MSIVCVAAGDCWMEMMLTTAKLFFLFPVSPGADNRPPAQFTEALGNAEARPQMQPSRFKGKSGAPSALVSFLTPRRPIFSTKSAVQQLHV